jgi:thiol:disulfide interchange protein DsbD
MLGLGGGGDAKPEPVQVLGTAWHRLADGRAAVLVRFEVQRDWHMYWTNPGDSGAPPVAAADLPEGWKLGEPIWPRPAVQRLNGDTLFEHEGEWGWLVPVEGPSPRAVPDFAIELRLSWMACKQACVVGKRAVKVPAPVGEPSPAPARCGASAFPVALAATDRVQVQQGVLRLDLDARGQATAQFLQATDPGVSVGERNPVAMRVQEGRATLELPLEVRPQDSLGKPLAVSGLVLLGEGRADACVWIRASVPQSPSKPAVAP